VALHGTSTGTQTFNQVLFSWGMMLLFSAVDVWIAGRLFKVMIHKASADATLGLE
jgi:hypothetical protein